MARFESGTEKGQLVDSLLVGIPLYSASFSPDGKNIATAGYELPIREWDIPDTLPRFFLGHLNENYFVDYSPDGKQLVSCGWDKTARLWDRASATQIRSFPHPDGVNGAAFSPDGTVLYTACRDKFVRRWDVTSGKLLAVFGD